MSGGLLRHAPVASCARVRSTKRISSLKVVRALPPTVTHAHGILQFGEGVVTYTFSRRRDALLRVGCLSVTTARLEMVRSSRVCGSYCPDSMVMSVLVWEVGRPAGRCGSGVGGVSEYALASFFHHHFTH